MMGGAPHCCRKDFRLMHAGRGSRLEQIVDWCGGEAFDGAIVFDECHKCGPARSHDLRSPGARYESNTAECGGGMHACRAKNCTTTLSEHGQIKSESKTSRVRLHPPRSRMLFCKPQPRCHLRKADKDT